MMTLATPRLTIEPLEAEHAAGLADFFRRNDAHLRPWDPPRPAGVREVAFWAAEAARAAEDRRDGAALRWVLRAPAAGAVLGRVNITQIVRGPFQSCMLGYALDAAQQGRGLMHEALQAVLPYCFESLKLHRVQAGYLPTNLRSARLLARLGFRVEGLARDYLFIDGAWRDHVLTALTWPAFDTRVFAR
jgi:ribosomal-protein-alanine N-acetyltransferase